MFLKTASQLKSLFTIPQYFTMKSKRQFTPNVIQNPKLTKHGIIQRIPKSYDYNLPQTLPNRHLYWDRNVQNRARRAKYNQARLKKLQINPIHENGKRTFNRPIEQILREISQIKVVRTSVNRTFTNLAQVLIRFKDNLSPEDRQIAIATINDIHDRFLPSMSLYHFSTYCQIRCLAKMDCTEAIFIHFYKFIQQFAQESRKGNQVKKFRFSVFLKLLRYVFSRKNADYLKKNQDLMYKNRQMFKLFEDNDPRLISFEELVPDIYSLKQVENDLSGEEVQQNLKYLYMLPGGKQLLQKLGF